MTVFLLMASEKVDRHDASLKLGSDRVRQRRTRRDRRGIWSTLTHVTAMLVTAAPPTVPAPPTTVHVCGAGVAGCVSTVTAYAVPESCAAKLNAPSAVMVWFARAVVLQTTEPS